MIAPGRACGAYTDGSGAGNRSLDGTGRKEPYSASARLPSSVQMGSCTVTRNTLHKQIGTASGKGNSIIPIGECSLDLDIMDQGLNARMDVVSSQQSFSVLHELRDGMISISDTLLEYGSYEGDCLRPVEGETPSESFLGERASLGHSQRSFAIHSEMANGPGEGGVCPVLAGESSWFGAKNTIRLLSPSPYPCPRAISPVQITADKQYIQIVEWKAWE